LTVLKYVGPLANDLQAYNLICSSYKEKKTWNILVIIWKHFMLTWCPICRLKVH